MPIDVVGLVAVILGMMTVLIPITGLTARFALKPIVESFALLFQNKTVEETVAITERRVALLESQIESMEESLRRLADATEFDRQLTSGGTPDDGSEAEGSA